jgi:hypothetical protein
MSGKLTRFGVRVHKILEDSTSRAKVMLPQRRHLEGSFAARILGATLLRKRFWSLKGEDLARGLALGMFIAFTPTIGLHMTLVCLLIMLYPGNLPIALAACWVVNPLTAVPVFGAEWYVGKWILGFFGYQAGQPPRFHEYESLGQIIHYVVRQGGTLWLGSIIVSALLAAASYWTVIWITYLERWLRKIKLDHHRKLQRERRKARRESASAAAETALEDAERPEMAQSVPGGDGLS